MLFVRVGCRPQFQAPVRGALAIGGTKEQPGTTSWIGFNLTEEYQAVTYGQKMAAYNAGGGAIEGEPRVYPGLVFGAKIGTGP